MQYIATINTPGYLPDSDDEPAVFDTAKEAWEYLAEDRQAALDETEDDVDPGDDPVLAAIAPWVTGREPAPGDRTVTGTTPGYDGDHDLGLAYTVTVAES